MKKKYFIFLIIVVLAVIILLYNGIQLRHTFTLSDQNITRSEQIQPLFGTVKVRCNCDTAVVFTDIETKEEYVIGYITSGMSEKIKLQKGRWYTVSGGGDITVGPVNVCIE